MVLSRTTSFQNLETQVKEGFGEFWSQSKVRITGFCHQVQTISNNIMYNITYIFNQGFPNRTSTRNKNNPSQTCTNVNDNDNVPYYIRHSMVINELKNREIDKEWETLGKM